MHLYIYTFPKLEMELIVLTCACTCTFLEYIANKLSIIAIPRIALNSNV